jgi:hypothetical protein
MLPLKTQWVNWFLSFYTTVDDIAFHQDIMVKTDAYAGTSLLAAIDSIKEGWFPWKLFNKNLEESPRCCDALRLDIFPKFDKEIFSVIDQGLKDYAEHNPYFVVEKDDGYTLLKAIQGDSIPTHWEPRTLKAMLFLTDSYKGGELVFPRQNLTLKPKSGTLILVPGSFLYPHLVNPILSGERIEIVTWFQ